MTDAGPDRAVILAGGGGTRLWPWTGPDRPKPLLPLGGRGRTLLRATVERLGGLLDADAIAVQAAPELGRVLQAAEPGLATWPEPSPRDTGPAIALAMRRVLLEAPSAVVAVLPADHRIADEDAFRAALRVAAGAARAGEIALVGIRPHEATDRFGYLQPGRAAGGLMVVERFVEKPAPDRARELVAQGALWNGGMFVWRADVFWAALETHAPDIAGPVAATIDGDAAAWPRATKTSIDYALLEKVPRRVAVPLEAGWDDVGGWDAVLRLVAAGDAGPAARVAVGGDAPEGTIVLSVGDAVPERAIVLGDAPQLVVVGPSGILVAPRDRMDDVKRYVVGAR